MIVPEMAMDVTRKPIYEPGSTVFPLKYAWDRDDSRWVEWVVAQDLGDVVVAWRRSGDSKVFAEAFPHDTVSPKELARAEAVTDGGHHR